MGVLTMVGQVILALAILITLHELGHFAAARILGIRVEKFYLFFDAWGLKLFSFKKGDTEYGIGWLPLGGYVKIAGMIDESLDTEQIKKPAEPWEFRSKPAWQRLIVMLGGVTVNAILGIFIMSMLLFGYGDEYLPNKNLKYGIHALPLGKKIGFMDGDKIISINGKKVEKFKEALNPEIILKDKTTYIVLRGNEQITIETPPNFADLYTKLGKDSGFIAERVKFKLGEISPNSPAKKSGLQKGDFIIKINDKNINYFNEFKESIKSNSNLKFTIVRGIDTFVKEIAIGKEPVLGFMPDLYEYNEWTMKEKYSFFGSFPEGYKRSKDLIKTQLIAFGKMFKGQMDPRKSLAGPIQIGQLFGDTWHWERFWSLTAMISIVLAFMNLLPIPALDGGHVFFLLIEMIIRRPLPEKFMYVMQIIGMVILFALMIFIFGNDIFQAWFSK
ncbi:MAG: RIP metalloprotease RseP [Bacteroidetes bacterium]|nr:RIP metalloprotease RseP [Bacteroidota bacterium]